MAAMHNNNNNEEAGFPMEKLIPPAGGSQNNIPPPASAMLAQTNIDDHQRSANPPTPTPTPAEVAKLDPKRLKRILANRLYSERYRHKQMNYTVQLENKMKSLEDEITINSPQIPYFQNHNSILAAENNFLKQKLNAYTVDLQFKQAQHEELKKEKDILFQHLCAIYPKYKESLEAKNPDNNSQSELAYVNSSQPTGFNSTEE